ncbi:MAG: hypothetical protein WD847_10845 [Pirellulales bacterium]
MSANARDEFPESVKRVVAERAAYICTNPECREPTVGPHSDPSKSLKTAKACHITAAAAGGPRYDVKQSTQHRRGIQNAIWLCSKCSDIIDKDEAAFPRGLLLQWRAAHERWIRNGGIIPELPRIAFATLNGLTIGNSPGSVTAEQIADLREHRFCIENPSGIEIKDLDAEVQLPEPVVHSFGVDKPAGVNVGWEPIRVAMQVYIKGGGCVTRGRPPLPALDYRLQIDRIPPTRKVEIGFVSSLKVLKDHDMSFGLPSDPTDPRIVLHLVDGSFQFEYRGAVLRRRFCARIVGEVEKRTYSIAEVMPTFGDWKPIKHRVWS